MDAIINTCTAANSYLKTPADIIIPHGIGIETYLNEQKLKITEANLTDQGTYLGKVEFDKLPGLCRSMDIVCAVSRNEGYRLTQLEAMASGVAVLTSEAGAWKDIVENGVQGYWVPTGDVNAIQEKRELMINNPEKLAEMGITGLSVKFCGSKS
jgi:mannosyltransferase